MILIGLDGVILECPNATGWTLTDGRIHVVSDDGAEHGVFSRWDYIIDGDDFRGVPDSDAGGVQDVPPCATHGPPCGTSTPTA